MFCSIRDREFLRAASKQILIWRSLMEFISTLAAASKQILNDVAEKATQHKSTPQNAIKNSATTTTVTGVDCCLLVFSLFVNLYDFVNKEVKSISSWICSLSSHMGLTFGHAAKPRVTITESINKLANSSCECLQPRATKLTLYEASK